jgi:hypothetical protein
MPPATLSIVVVSLNDHLLLKRCLDAIAKQKPDTAETLVVRDSARWPQDADRAEYRADVWIDAPPGTTVPRMRALGALAARGDVIGLVEDDCLVGEGWCQYVLEAHRGPEAAVGGAVEPGPYRRMRDWAVYFHEYSRFMRPLPVDGPIAGNHVTYKRDAIVDTLGAEGELNDVFLHAAWAGEGRPMRADDRLVARNINNWPFSALTNMPYHHGRALAARRFSRLPAGRRIVRAAGTTLLPVLQLARMIGTIARRQRYALQFVGALPATLLFGVSWSIGEIAGCLFGDGGSAARWR